MALEKHYKSLKSFHSTKIDSKTQANYKDIYIYNKIYHNVEVNFVCLLKTGILIILLFGEAHMISQMPCLNISRMPHN